MSRKDLMIDLIRVFSAYEKRYEVPKELQDDFTKKAIEVFKSTAPYTCMRCGRKTGLSTHEKNHDCNNPMFDENAMPFKKRLIEECASIKLDFENIYNSVKVIKCECMQIMPNRE